MVRRHQYTCALDTDLIRVLNEVVEADEACDELTVDKVVSLVDGAQTPVRVVVGIRTETEWTVCK